MAKKLIATLLLADGQTPVEFYGDENVLEVCDPVSGTLRYHGNTSEHSGVHVTFEVKHHAHDRHSLIITDPGTYPSARQYYGSERDIKKIVQ